MKLDNLIINQHDTHTHAVNHTREERGGGGKSMSGERQATGCVWSLYCPKMKSLRERERGLRGQKAKRLHSVPWFDLHDR